MCRGDTSRILFTPTSLNNARQRPSPLSPVAGLQSCPILPSSHPPRLIPNSFRLIGINLDSSRLIPISNPRFPIPDFQSPISPFVTAPRPRAPTAPQACCRTPIIRSPVRRAQRGVRGLRVAPTAGVRQDADLHPHPRPRQRRWATLATHRLAIYTYY